MFKNSIKLFNLFGFEVKIDLSWLILAILITWSLATGVFPAYYKNLSTATYWWMGVIGAVGLFLSIVFHEFSHSIVARKFDIPMKGITLFIFGGVAQMNEEPPSAKSEMYMAIAGPAASVVIAGIFFGISTAGNFTTSIQGVLRYLAFLNILLAGFNLIPAFPLDGGRVLRSILWLWKNDLRWSTKISARIGSGFGVILMIFGGINFIFGNFIGGVWYFLIGMFLRSISRSSYQQVLIRRALEGEKVKRFMTKQPVTVVSSTRLDELVEDYVYKYHYKFFPIVNDSQLVGCVTTNKIKEIPRSEWHDHTVGEISNGCANDNTIQVDADAVQALSMMRRTNNSRLMVVDYRKLVGIISLKDLLRFLSLKIDLEEKE